MIAGRVGGDAKGRFVFTQPKDGVAGAAHFESSSLLKVLTLKKEFGPGQLVQITGRQDGRFVDVGFDPFVGGQNIVKRGYLVPVITHGSPRQSVSAGYAMAVRKWFWAARTPAPSSMG
jgi:hypothetical protein